MRESHGLIVSRLLERNIVMLLEHRSVVYHLRLIKVFVNLSLSKLRISTQLAHIILIHISFYGDCD